MHLFKHVKGVVTQANIRCSQVVTLDMGLLVAGTKYRGEFEERLKKLMEEIKQNDDIILVSLVPALVLPVPIAIGHMLCGDTGM